MKISNNYQSMQYQQDYPCSACYSFLATGFGKTSENFLSLFFFFYYYVSLSPHSSPMWLCPHHLTTTVLLCSTIITAFYCSATFIVWITPSFLKTFFFLLITHVWVFCPLLPFFKVYRLDLFCLVLQYWSSSRLIPKHFLSLSSV